MEETSLVVTCNLEMQKSEHQSITENHKPCFTTDQIMKKWKLHDPHLNKQAKKKTIIAIKNYLHHNTRIAEGSLFLVNVEFAICFWLSVWMEGLAFAGSNRGIYIPVREV